MTDTDKKTILVTGGAGFVGSNLCKRLYDMGHRVISLDNYFAGSTDAHHPGIEYINGHTKDIANLVKVKPDLVYHLGEYARVEKSLLDPTELVWDLNKTGTFAVLEFCKKHQCKLVYAGSSTKFGDDGDNRNATPYGWTKATNTELVQNYGRWFGLDYAITYFYNVYGPGERSGSYGTLIAIFLEQFRNNQPITVVSPGTQERNFTHVDDIVDGLVLVGEKGSGDGYALGNQKAFSIIELARLFGREIVMLPERAGNRMSAGLDTSKTRDLGWNTQRNLEDYLYEQISTDSHPEPMQNRVLVIAPTFYPTMGPAEQALYELIQQMPDINFDVITTKYSLSGQDPDRQPLTNATIHYVGHGNARDKYFLPWYGYRKAQELHGKHNYLFCWALMASYAALAAIRLRRKTSIPLMITLADQNIDRLPYLWRKLTTFILHQADQVFATDRSQESMALALTGKRKLRTTIGSADAFANQLRYAYVALLKSNK